MSAVSAERLLSALRVLGEPRPGLAEPSSVWMEPRPVRLAGSWLTVDSPTMQVRVVDQRLHLPTASVDFDVLARVAAHVDPGWLVFRGDTTEGLLVEGPRESWTVPYAVSPSPAWTEDQGPRVTLVAPHVRAALTAARVGIGNPVTSGLSVLECAHVTVTDGAAVFTGSDRHALTRVTVPAATTQPGVLLLPAELLDALLALDEIKQLTFEPATVHFGRGPSPAIHATALLPGNVIVEINTATTDRAYPAVDLLINQQPDGWSFTANAHMLHRATRALAANASSPEHVHVLPDGKLTTVDRTACADLTDHEVPPAATHVQFNLARLTRLTHSLQGLVTVTGGGPGDTVHFHDTFGLHALLAPIRPTDEPKP